MDKPSRGIPAEIGVVAVVAAASLPLGRIFRQGAPGELDYPSIQFVVLILSAVVAWSLRRFRVPVLAAAGISAFAFLWLGSAMFHSAAMFGPFPTPHSVGLLFESFSVGLKQVNVEVAPVAPTAGFLSLAAVGIWATLWLADDAANRLRHPLLAIGLTLPMFAMPGTLLRAPRGWFEVGIFSAAALLLLFQDERIRISRWAGASIRGWRPGVAARIGVVAIILGVAFAPLLPGYGQPPGGTIRSRAGGRVTINPLVSIKPTLDRFPAVTLFRVSSPVATYWRLTALDRFNGTVWTSSGDPGRISLTRSVKRSSPAPDATKIVQHYTIDNLAGPWIPAAFEPVAVRGARDVLLQPATRSLLTGGSLRIGQRVTVTSELPVPSGDDLLHDDGPDPAGSRFLALPADLPPVIRRIAADITARATTRVEKAIALQNYLRTFEYDLQVALKHSSFDMVRFLTVVRAGYCEQFAATMAVMARSLGIPARVAIGFGGGDLVAQDTYQVTSNHAHAWVEIHFPGYGWLAFEPTPRSDGPAIPTYSRLTPEATQPTASPSAAPATPTPSVAPTSSSRPDPGESSPRLGRGSSTTPVLAPLAAGVLLLLLIVALPGVAFARRTLRRRRARGERELTEIRYIEFLEWCRAVSLGRKQGETPVEHARRLGALPKASPQPIQNLARVATAAVYAPDPPHGADVRAARTAITPSVPLPRRLLPLLGWGWWRNELRVRD